MSSRSDRAGKIGFQLAALVDLLFVITFLLIWEREAMMQKRLQKVQAVARSAQSDAKKVADVQKAALEALAQAEKDKVKAQQEVRKLSERLAELNVDQQREKKLERDLHTQFDWMLEGMRKGKSAAVLAAPGAPGAAGPGAPGSVAPQPATSGPARLR